MSHPDDRTHSDWRPRDHGIHLGEPRHGVELTPEQAQQFSATPQPTHADLAVWGAMAAAVQASHAARVHRADPVLAALTTLAEWGYDVVPHDHRHDDTAPVAADVEEAPRTEADVREDDLADAIRLTHLSGHARYDSRQPGHIPAVALLDGDPDTCRSHIEFCTTHARRTITDPLVALYVSEINARLLGRLALGATRQ